MVHEILEQHRTGLSRFGRVVGVMGWVLLIAAIVLLGKSVVVFLIRQKISGSLIREVLYTIRFITPAFFAIGLGQLIRFSLTNQQPRRVLRYGHIIMFIIAGLNILYAIWGLIFFLIHWDYLRQSEVWMNAFIGSCFQLVYGVLLIGIGVAIREVLSVVEESKTLV